MTLEEEVKALLILNNKASRYYSKAYENFVCFLDEEKTPRTHPKVTRLYYACILAFKGNLYKNQVGGDVGHGGDLVLRINGVYSGDADMIKKASILAELYELRRKADYEPEILSIKYTAEVAE